MKKILLICLAAVALFASVYSMSDGNFDIEKASAYRIEGLEGDEYIEGIFDGDLYILNSNCILNDAVDGNLYIEDSVLTVGLDGSVGGMVYVKNSTILYSENEITAGYVEIGGDSLKPSVSLEEEPAEVVRGTKNEKKGLSGFLTDKIIFYIFLFLLTALIRYVIKKTLTVYISDFNAYLVKYLLLGMGFWVLLPIAIVIFVITVIGIPIIILIMLLFMFSMIVGFIVFAEWLGTKIDFRTSNPFITGFFVIMLTEFILNMLKIYVNESLFAFFVVLFWTFIGLTASGFALRYIKNLFTKKK